MIDKTNGIIGGLFGLECALLTQSPAPPFLTGREVFLVNARSGIWLLVNRLRPHQVWVPSYLCHTMIGAIDPNMTVLRFYEVNFDLKVRSNQWVSEVTSGDLVIFIDYFGFPYDRQLGLCVKEKGAWVLEDACQALLSREVGGSSDFVIFSPRKFLGVPDGGVLILNRELDFHDIDLVPSPAEWWLQAFCAGVLRREFDVHGGNRRWFELFQQTELTSPIGYYAMSELSKALLMHSFDYSTISQQRIDNYRLLARALADIALFPSLSANIVPLGFPIRVKNRDRLRQVLFDHKIYPPVHWPIRGIVPGKFRDSHKLAGEIMTLPCDQRYDAIDMKRMAELVNEVLEC